jgi:hypothetical protein
MSTIKANSIVPVTAGSEDYFLARAWVNFNGTGTIAIREDGNVSSLTDNGTGNYTVTYSNSIVDANYAVSGSAGGTSRSFIFSKEETSPPVTGSVRVRTIVPGVSTDDDSNVNVGVIR